MTPYLEKLKKLKALAERGIGGEKENAEQILDALCRKYGVSRDDLGEDKIEVHWFRLKNIPNSWRLLHQCAFKAIGNTTFKAGTNSHRRRQFGIECTAAQAIEIELDYAFYAKHLKSEFDRFYTMFLNANSIFPLNCEEKEGGSKLTTKDIMLYQGLEQRSRTKQIEGGD